MVTTGLCQTVFLTSRGTRRGIVAQTGRSSRGFGAAGAAARVAGFGTGSRFLAVSSATEATEVKTEASVSAASSRASGGRVERTGGVAAEAILACEVCSRRCSLVVL